MGIPMTVNKKATLYNKNMKCRHKFPPFDSFRYAEVDISNRTVIF